MDIDEESLKLAIQLQREDLELWEARQGKCHMGDSSQDSEVILAACREELDKIEIQASDRVLAQSISNAVQADAPEIAAIAAAEQEAAQDREYALRLSRDPAARPTSPEANNQPDEQPALNDEAIERSKDLDITPQSSDLTDRDDDYEEELPQDESSKWTASHHQKTLQCLICRDEFPKLALSKTPCSHDYCRQCLINLVQTAIRDESLFPPRCCGQEIPVEISPFFDPQLVGQFRAKKLEFEAPDRTYCHDPTCSKFIPSQFIKAETGTCPACDKKTCVLCKGKTHDGVCPQDTASQEVLQLAQAEGWQQCSSCKRVIDLVHGCNHITCLCGFQFCYVCGERWKTCQCPQWNEERLLARANELVNRQLGAAQIDARARQARTQEVQRHLVENHECIHRRWTNRNGAHQCEECLDNMPYFIFECRQCGIMACARCRYNRL